MNRDPYVSAINNALTEIQKAYPAITHSFIFTNDGSIVTDDTEIDEETLKTVLESFEPLKEKAKAIGNLTSLTINGQNGKLTLTNVNDTYLGLIATDKADENQIHFITHAILPPLLKTLKTYGPSSLQQNASEAPQNIPQNVPSHLQTPFAKTLIVDPLSGFFDGNAVQVDEETLIQWSENKEAKGNVDQVKIETIDGNSSICKVKKITVRNLQGKERVRVPAKICNQLKLSRGDKVNISPNI